MAFADKSFSTDSCINCGNSNIGEYCPDCGQKSHNERFTTKSFILIFLNAFDLERGFFHTMIMLIKDPGKIINDYLKGKTKRYFNPLKYLIIIAGINALLVVWLNIFDAQENTTVELLGEKYRTGLEESNISQFIKNYLNILELIMIPVFSLVAKWFYNKKHLFYGEHLIILCFLFAQTSVISIIFQPFYLIFPILYQYSFLFSTVIIFSYLTYGLYKVHKKSVFNSFIGTVTIYVLGLLMILTSSLIVSIIIGMIKYFGTL